MNIVDEVVLALLLIGYLLIIATWATDRIFSIVDASIDEVFIALYGETDGGVTGMRRRRNSVAF